MQILWHSRRRAALAFLFSTTLLAAAAHAGDADSDGIPDASDNCPLAGNAMQLDGDYDGFGNRCDPDFNNDGVVDVSDLEFLKSVFLESNTVADLDASGSVDFADLAILKRYFGAAPGTPPAVSGRVGSRDTGGTDGVLFLLPAQAAVFLDNILTLEVHLDFTADATLGGAFDLLFDNTLLEFVSWQPAALGDPAFSRPPDVEAGALRGFAVGDFDGITGPGLVGTVSFVALSLGNTTVDLSETITVWGGFWSAIDLMPQEVEYLGAEIAIIDEPGPRILAEPLALDFGGVSPGDLTTESVTVTNAGDLDLTIGAIGAIDGLSPPFALVGDGCSGQVLLPDGSCTLEVEFAPEGVSDYVDTFDIPSNALDFPALSVTVTGSTANTPVIVVLPPTHVFVNVPLFSSSLQDFALVNNGGADLVIDSIDDQSSFGAPFLLESDECSGAVLEPGGLCFIVVRYTPLEANVLSEGTLTIASNDPLSPSVELEVRGTPAPPVETDVFGKTSGLGSPFHQVRCVNRTTGQSVVDTVPVLTGWNCRELGLVADEGDTIEVYIVGGAE